MFSNPFVQLCLSVSLIMAVIVGYGVMLFIVLAAIFYPVTRFVRTIGIKARGNRRVSVEALADPTWNPLFETFEEKPDLRYKTMYVPSWQVDDQTQTLPAPEMSAADYPGLSWFSGRPLKADSEDTQFMEKVDVMHHQL